MGCLGSSGWRPPALCSSPAPKPAGPRAPGGGEGPRGPVAAGLTNPQPEGRDRVRAAVPDGGPRLSPPACPPAALGWLTRLIPVARGLWGCWSGIPGIPCLGRRCSQLGSWGAWPPRVPSCGGGGLEVPLPPCAMPRCFRKSEKSSKPGKPPRTRPSARCEPGRAARGVPLHATRTRDQRGEGQCSPGSGTPAGPRTCPGSTRGGAQPEQPLFPTLSRPWGIPQPPLAQPWRSLWGPGEAPRPPPLWFNG